MESRPGALALLSRKPCAPARWLALEAERDFSVSSEPCKACKIHQLLQAPPPTSRSKNLETEVVGLEEREAEVFKINKTWSFKENPKEGGLVEKNFSSDIKS